jgi:phosphatidylserine/phosphatidylglycerophosphate/cardiolipin synthase-like enzyme
MDLKSGYPYWAVKNGLMYAFKRLDADLSCDVAVLERKVEHRYKVSDPQFRREMSVLLGPAIVRGNKVTALQNGDEIFPAMLLAICSAQTSITFETYIYWSGEIGEEFSQALSERARARGVRVRILLPGPHIDSLTIKIASKADWGALLHAGAEIYVYQPTMLHTKLLVIDGDFVSVGSTNFDIRSIRLNDEASLNIYSSDFATQMTAVFEADLLAAESYSLARWQSRPLREKFSEKILLPIKSQL